MPPFAKSRNAVSMASMQSAIGRSWATCSSSRTRVMANLPGGLGQGSTPTTARSNPRSTPAGSIQGSWMLASVPPAFAITMPRHLSDTKAQAARDRLELGGGYSYIAHEVGGDRGTVATRRRIWPAEAPDGHRQGV